MTTNQWIGIVLLFLFVTSTSPKISNNVEPRYLYDGFTRSSCPAHMHIGNQPNDRQDTSLKLQHLRMEMSRMISVQGPPLNGYIVTSDDQHQSQSVDPRDMRREFLTGFYGSAGTALVTLDKAVLWTDGRYHLQADQQLDCNWILIRQEFYNAPSITEWLIHEFQNQQDVRIGADATLIPAYTWDAWENALRNSSITLVGVVNNLVDFIWHANRPNYNQYPAYVLENQYSGESWQNKVDQIREQMELEGADAFVVTALDEIAWLFNIRGYDLPNTPVLRAYAIVTRNSIDFYAPRHKIPRTIENHLKILPKELCHHKDCVFWKNYTLIWLDLRTMSQIWNKVWLPSPCGYSQGASKEIHSCIPENKRLIKASPIVGLRAQKNRIEAEGMRRSHIRDAVAMCDFLAYMEEQIELDSTGWDEMQVARLVNEFRLEIDNNRGIAFPTIAGYGPHAALPHYEPTNLTNSHIGKESTLVVDSGGQYLDGTTDVTRTLHFGEPTKEQKEAYTRVLIGSIQLSSLIFPHNLRTDQLDSLAREPLWKIGHDYMHGTGHGVGHFSCVHESPIGVSYLEDKNQLAGCNSLSLKPGFFLSNEPGYYKEGEFGIRLENVLEVVDTNLPSAQNGRRFLKFKDVTLVPYEPKLIDIDLLSPEHRRWLNMYNQRIRDEVGAELKKRLRMNSFSWMLKKTRHIPELEKIDRTIFPSFTGSRGSSFKGVDIIGIFFIAFCHIYRNNFMYI